MENRIYYPMKKHNFLKYNCIDECTMRRRESKGVEEIQSENLDERIEDDKAKLIILIIIIIIFV